MTNQHATGRGKRPKVVFAGIDGASWDVMQPLLDDGQLPNISLLLSGGSRCNLRSTVPPISPVAWATMMTGVNPGKHGVTGWADLTTRKVFSSGDVHAPFVWDVISRAGLSAGVFNIPMTYPAEALDGYMVSGEIGTVEYGARMFHPPELFDEVNERVPDYAMPAAEAERTRYGFDRLQANARTRYEMLAHLLRTRPTDVVIAGVNYVDYAQHTRIVSRVGDEGEDVVAWAYREADRFVGLLMQAAGEDACIVLASDHGAGPVEGYVNLPALLRDLGLLKTGGRKSLTRRALWRLRRVALGLRKLLPGKSDRRLLGRARKSLRSLAYDWARTIAYAVPASYAVAINTGERSPAPAVTEEDVGRVAREVAQAIEQVVNPITGDRDLKALLAQEEYEGPWAATAPEVLLDARGCSYHMVTIGPDAPQVFLTPAEFAAEYPALHKWEGMHRPNGVLAISGPGIAADELADASPSVMDIAPTLLELAGISLPDEALDGRSVVRRGDGPRIELTTADVQAEGAGDEAAQYSDEEARRIEKRLEDLGYF